MGAMQDVENALKNAMSALATASDPKQVEEIRIHYLGRKGLIPALFKKMGEIPNEQKREFGMLINSARDQIKEAIDKAAAKAAAGKEDADKIDVTLPGRRHAVGKKHPINRTMDDMVNIFRRMGFIAADGPDLETVYNNFDALNTPDDHPSRDEQDTFYLPDGRLLRTQTSPVQIRMMKSQKPPIRIVCPGRCYRRDTPDATHSMTFHQIEGLYIDKNVSLADLKGTLLHFAQELLGKDVKLRFRPHFFPFTEPSIEYDFSCIMCGGEGCRICKNSGWLEISGAGMVDPNVLKECGLDPEEWSGFAFGLGIERIAMIRYAISDIRLLYENDLRFLNQF